MAAIFDLTCPATIGTPQYHGHLQLHRNVQFMDPVTISECHLVHMNGPTETDHLDGTQSYITARDFMDDGNTFKTMDHLIASPNVHELIHPKGMIPSCLVTGKT